MSAPTTSIFLNSTTPAPPTGKQNVVFQSDGATPEQSISAYVDAATKLLLSSAVAGQPGGSQNVLIFTATQAFTFPGNFSSPNSYGSVGTNPTATANYTVNKTSGGTTTGVGTIAVSTAGAFTFATTSGASFSLAAGDRLTIVAPGTPDATLADVSFTLVATT